jgi:excisionase family DNA binding protein
MSGAVVTSVGPGEVEAEVAARALRRIKDFLARHPDGPDEIEVLVEGGGEALVLPRPALGMFAQILAQLAEGRGGIGSAVARRTHHTAGSRPAERVRPYLIGLVESGKIPFRKIGRHRRIRFEDLLEVKRRDDADRRPAADDLGTLSQDLAR